MAKPRMDLSAFVGGLFEEQEGDVLRGVRLVIADAHEGLKQAINTVLTGASWQRKVADGLRPRFPRAATLLEGAAEDLLAYRRFPPEHQRQLDSTNVLERLNKEMHLADPETRASARICERISTT